MSVPARRFLLPVLALAACGDTAKLHESAGVGPNPMLPEPVHTLLPTVHIAPAKGWPTPQSKFWMANAKAKTSRPQPFA